MRPATIEFQRMLIRAGQMALRAWSTWLDTFGAKDIGSGPPVAPITPSDPRGHDAALGPSEASQ